MVIHSPREHSHRRGEEGEAAQPSLGALVPHLVTEGRNEGGDLGGEEGKRCVWCLHSVRCPAHLLLGCGGDYSCAGEKSTVGSKDVRADILLSLCGKRKACNYLVNKWTGGHTYILTHVRTLSLTRSPFLQPCVQWVTCHPEVWFTELTLWPNPVGCSEPSC